MAVMLRKRSPKMTPWAAKVENYLLLLRKEQLVELLRSAGQSVSSLKHKPPEQIRQAILALPQETVRMVLREEIRRKQKD